MPSARGHFSLLALVALALYFTTVLWYSHTLRVADLSQGAVVWATSISLIDGDREIKQAAGPACDECWTIGRDILMYAGCPPSFQISKAQCR